MPMIKVGSSSREEEEVASRKPSWLAQQPAVHTRYAQKRSNRNGHRPCELVGQGDGAVQAHIKNDSRWINVYEGSLASMETVVSTY